MQSNSMLTLGKIIAEKQAKDLALIEELTSKALQSQSDSLKELSKQGQITMQNAISEQTNQALESTRALHNQIVSETEQVSKLMRHLLMKPFLIVLAMTLGMILASWSVIEVLSTMTLKAWKDYQVATNQLEFIQGLKTEISDKEPFMWIELMNPLAKFGSYSDKQSGRTVIYIKMPSASDQLLPAPVSKPAQQPSLSKPKQWTPEYQKNYDEMINSVKQK